MNDLNDSTQSKELQHTQNLVSDLSNTTTPKEIVAHSGQKIGALGDIEGLNECLRYVFILIGLKAENMPSDPEKMVLRQYIRSNLGHFTLEDIRMAFELKISKKLSKNHHYQTFSAAYLAEVMAEYDEHLQSVKNKHAMELKKIEDKNKLSVELTDEEKKLATDEFLKTWYIEPYQQYLKTGQFNIPMFTCSVLYFNLKKTGKLVLTPEQIETIKLRAKQDISEQRPRDFSEHMRRKQDSESHEQHLERLYKMRCHMESIYIHFEDLKSKGIKEL